MAARSSTAFAAFAALLLAAGCGGTRGAASDQGADGGPSGSDPESGSQDDAAGPVVGGSDGGLRTSNGDAASAADGGPGSVSDGGASLCPGTLPPPAGYTTCRTSQDCGGHDCVLDPTPSSCGGDGNPLCHVDTDCPSGTVCDVYSCNLQCVPPCTADSCAAGTRCSANGHCVLQLCTDGFTCSSPTRCDPSDSNADTRGCVDPACALDSDCPCGACIFGECRPRVYVCTR